MHFSLLLIYFGSLNCNKETHHPHWKFTIIDLWNSVICRTKAQRWKQCTLEHAIKTRKYRSQKPESAYRKCSMDSLFSHAHSCIHKTSTRKKSISTLLWKSFAWRCREDPNKVTKAYTVFSKRKTIMELSIHVSYFSMSLASAIVLYYLGDRYRGTVITAGGGGCY